MQIKYYVELPPRTHYNNSPVKKPYMDLERNNICHTQFHNDKCHVKFCQQNWGKIKTLLYR